MSEENDVKFQEVQRFPSWLRIIGFIFLFVVVVIDIYSVRSVVINKEPVGLPTIILFIAAGILLPIAISLLFVTIKLETQVRGDGLYVRMFPLHINYKKFTPGRLSEYYARDYRPILEYGGWGIRWGLSGKAYNIRGNKGVQLVFKDGKRLLIGSQRPQELVEAMNSVMEKKEQNEAITQ